MWIAALEQRPQVVVLAEEGVEAAVVGHLGAGQRPVVDAVGPARHPAAQIALALQNIHRDTAFGKSGGGSQSGDPGTDHDDMRNGRKCGGTRQPGRTGVADPARIFHL